MAPSLEKQGTLPELTCNLSPTGHAVAKEKPLLRSASATLFTLKEETSQDTKDPPRSQSGPAIGMDHRANTINSKSLVVVKGLGQGGFADVVEVKDTATGKRFAMKVIAKKRVSSRESRKSIHVEFSALTEMDPSPFVQQCHATFESPTNIFFIVDLISGGDLFFHFASRLSERNGWRFPESECRVMLAELALAVEHVHGQGYIHKDIKIENVMLDHLGHIKLVDFGLAEKLVAEVGPLECTGSLIYIAPELLRDRVGGRFTDWWAYGLLAHELLTGCTPWSSFEDNAVIKDEILSLDIEIPTGVSNEACEFLISLLDRNYETRLGTKSDRDVRGAIFFEGIDWQATALLECAPAFVPGTKPVDQSVNEKVLASYISRLEVPAVGEVAWFMGFDAVVKHPPYWHEAHFDSETLPSLF